MSTPTTWQLFVLVVVSTLGHAMALFWYTAVKRKWLIASRVIFDLPIPVAQLKREFRNSLHTPLHAILLYAFLALGSFSATSLGSFVVTALATTAWAEIWHYVSHRAFHLPALHWIHREHHKSHLNSWLTALSFSLSEKLIFDLGLIGGLSTLGVAVDLNFYGVAVWYIGYLAINSFSHANFELKSGAFTRGPGRVLTSTTYHSLHHARYTGNYGLGTRFLDRLFVTEWPDYERLYEKVAGQGVPLTRLSERVDP